MIIIPAIDLKGGNCVRLLHGEANQETIYSSNPVDMAKKWIAAGAKRLHVIDLDGAFSGEQKNFDLVSRIKKETNIFVQLGGGIRTMESIDRALDEGIDRIILGTIIFEQAGLAEEAFKKHSGRIMVALDARNGIVATRGWKESSGFPVKEALSVIEKLGGQEVIYTDIGRDGTLQGVNLESIITVMKMTSMKIFASGGVGAMADVEKLIEIKSPGCIVGKAIYEGKLDLAQAIQRAGS
jgi:phosphoribosylformimino-5-aminoimidazole carboxamide ribotide isomerase